MKNFSSDNAFSIQLRCSESSASKSLSRTISLTKSHPRMLAAAEMLAMKKELSKGGSYIAIQEALKSKLSSQVKKLSLDFKLRSLPGIKKKLR